MVYFGTHASIDSGMNKEQLMKFTITLSPEQVRVMQHYCLRRTFSLMNQVLNEVFPYEDNELAHRCNVIANDLDETSNIVEIIRQQIVEQSRLKER